MEKDFDDTISEQEKLFGELLDEIDEDEEEEEEETKEVAEKESEESEEEKERKEKERQKNKDAEEARKRREKEEKEKKRLEEEKKEQEDKKESSTQILGKQLNDFTKKYPNINLKSLDDDKHFTRFISGKLLGKKDFTELYEEYIEFKKDLSGKSESDIVRDYEKKRQASPGSLGAGGADVETAEVYTKKELDDITAKIPFMTEKQVAAVMGKYEKSLEYHSKK